MNSKQLRKKFREGWKIELKGSKYKKTVVFKQVGPDTYTCAGYTIVRKIRSEPPMKGTSYYYFQDNGRICDTLREISWVLDYEYYILLEYCGG